MIKRYCLSYDYTVHDLQYEGKLKGALSQKLKGALSQKLKEALSQKLKGVLSQNSSPNDLNRENISIPICY